MQERKTRAERQTDTQTDREKNPEADTYKAMSYINAELYSGTKKPIAQCGMMHIKEPFLLIRKSSPCGGSGSPLSLSEWSFTICLTPYNRK